VRDDEDEAGWKILRRFAPQLEEVTIHMFDRLWVLDNLTSSNPNLKDPENRGDVYDEHINTPDVWRRVFDFGRIIFPNLTKLELRCTARVSDHLLRFSPSIPNLESLELDCHFNSRDFGHQTFDYMQVAHVPSFPKLRHLNIDGNEETVTDILENVLPLAPGVKHLVIQLDDFESDGILCQHFQRIVELEELSSLAIYGQNSERSMNVLRAMQDQGGELKGSVLRVFLPSLEILVLERKYWSDSYGKSCFYPLLGQVSLDQQNIPSICS
jgi:hypothetical protein